MAFLQVLKKKKEVHYSSMACNQKHHHTYCVPFCPFVQLAKYKVDMYSFVKRTVHIMFSSAFSFTLCCWRLSLLLLLFFHLCSKFFCVILFLWEIGNCLLKWIEQFRGWFSQKLNRHLHVSCWWPQLAASIRSYEYLAFPCLNTLNEMPCGIWLDLFRFTHFFHLFRSVFFAAARVEYCCCCLFMSICALH